MTWGADRARRWVKRLWVGPALYDQGFARLDFARDPDPLADAQGTVGDAGPNSRRVNRQEIRERFMNVRLTQGILGFGVLAFALWFYPGPAGAQQPENTVVCIEGTGAIPLNYGDTTSGCAIDPAIDLDHFSFAGVAGTSVRINVLGKTTLFDPRLEILDPTGAVLVDQFCFGGSISTCSFTADLDLSLSGQYLIAVSDSGVNEVGDYQISLNCLYGSCPGAPALPEMAYDVAVEDALTPAVDMDFFTFQGAANTSIRLNVHSLSAGLDLRLEVRDPNGAVLDDQFCIGGSISTCSLAVDLDLSLSGQYLIAVSDAGVNEVGDFQISLNCLNGSCPGVPALPEIAYDVAVDDTITPVVDTDIFTFQGAANTSIRINVLGATTLFDPRLEVRDPNGAVLVDQFCFGGSISTCSFTVDLDPLLTGTYLIAVSDAGLDNTGSYSISLNCLFGSCPGAPALPEMAYDGAVDDTLTPAVDMDIFTFQGAANTSIRLNVHSLSAGLDLRLEVRDPNGAVLDDQFCIGGSISTCSVAVSLDLSLSGQYLVAVSDAGVNEVGNYQFSLNCLNGSCPGAPALPEIAYDVAVDDTITPVVDTDIFTFQGAANTSIRINVLGTMTLFDPRLEVRDPSGAVLDDQFCNSGSTATCSFAVDLNLSLTGQYLIAVSDAGLDNTGSYQISLNCLFGSCPGAPALPEIAYDVAVEDTLTPAVDMDVFSFPGAGGTSIRLNVNSLSAGLDLRLEVRDPAGAVLADQFCVGGSISTCSFTVDLDLSLPGQYVIAVSDAGVNEVGSYQFSLNCVFGSSCLVITPDTDFQVEGTVGGPFDTIETYTLTNNGDLSVDFTASASENFVTLSQTSGTLPGRASTTVEVSINANADNLAPGIHEAKVDFKNATNGQGDTDRLVQLTVKCPGTLEVTPGTDYRPLGPAGGPFAPVSKTYTLRNPLMDIAGTLCSSDIEFSVEAFGNFISLSTTSGTLKPDSTTTVTVSLNNNANGLAEGTYDGTVTFTNTTFNLGDTVRGVTLLVEPTMVEPKPPWTIVPLLDLLLPDESQGPDSP